MNSSFKDLRDRIILICWNIQMGRLLLRGGGGVELEVIHFNHKKNSTEINCMHVNISNKHKVKTCIKTHNTKFWSPRNPPKWEGKTGVRMTPTNYHCKNICLTTSNGLPYERPTLLKALHSVKSDMFKGFTNTYLKCYLVKGFITLLKVLQHSC